MSDNKTYKVLQQRVAELEAAESRYNESMAALEESLRKYRDLFENAPVGIFRTTSQGKPLSVNTSLARFLGFDSAEAALHHYRQLGAQLYVRPERREHFLHLLREKGFVENFEYEARTVTGRIIWLSMNAKVIERHKDGSFVIEGFSTNISERKQMEETLRHKEFLLEEMGKIARIGGWEFDPVTGEGTWTKEVYNIHEIEPGEIASFQMGMDFYQGESRDKIETAVTEAIELGKSYDLELELISAKGVHKWVHTRGRPQMNNGRVVHVRGSFQDITERKLAEQRLRESEDKLARSKKMESLGLLAGGVAHDLNNVLSGIVSYPELLLLNLPAESPLRKPIQTIEQSGKKAVAIVQDLLTVARGVAIEKQSLNLNDAISAYLKSPEYKKLLQFHPMISVTVQLDPHLFNIQGSPVHIFKALMNLVSNAAEAIPGSGSVSVKTTNRYIDRPLKGYDDVNVGEYAVMVVEDNGPGISSQDLKSIFEPFYTKKVMGRSGTGLGLAVVWNVVQDHKGYIDVSTSNSGTVFEMYFPITRDEILNDDKTLSISDYKGNKETILVVDDEESQREIICNMLDVLGYEAAAVPSGEKAIDYLKENSADLILLDMIMAPGINGRETYLRIIAIHPGQKAIIVSGFAETDDVKETQRMGAGRYIKKPFRLEKLGLAIKDALNER